MNWKAIVRNIFRSAGYGIHKIGVGGPYTVCYPFDYTTYSPWFESRFQEIYAKIRNHTVVTEDRCYLIHELCHHCAHLEGDFGECGVYRGGTAFLISHTLKNRSSWGGRLHLFDTFCGMPAMAEGDPSGHKMSDFLVGLDSVKTYLHGFPFVVFHAGVIPETFEKVKNRIFAFVHVDVDLYRTVKDCCMFFYPRMVEGGVMLFDDYGFPGYEFSAKRGVDEFFEDKSERPISFHSGQCVVVKL